jgi:hypothetical protein
VRHGWRINLLAPLFFSINSTNKEKAMRHQRIFGVATPLLFGAALLAAGSSNALAACGLQSADNMIKHVVHIQFDNVHLRRDNPNVPSDLEQMPNLLNFMQNNGTVSGNHHTAADLAHRNRHSYRAYGRLWRPHGRTGGE